MERVWVKNVDSDAVREVAESALPVLELSGWKPLTKQELAAHHKKLQARLDERLAALAPAAPDDSPTGVSTTTTPDAPKES